MPPILRQMRDLLQQDSVHHNEVGPHLVKGSYVLGKVCETQQKTSSSPSQTGLDRFLDELKDFGEVEALIEVFRHFHFSIIPAGPVASVFTRNQGNRLFKDWIFKNPLRGGEVEWATLATSGGRLSMRLKNPFPCTSRLAREYPSTWQARFAGEQ